MSVAVDMAVPVYKDAVVIGNGPSAITLSYMLAGNWPYYNGSSHPVDFLHYRLQDNIDKSLVEQDLRYLSEGLEGRSNNPVSLLFDVLNHPEADLGVDNPSLLSWCREPWREIDHVVLGKGPPGGAWHKMEGSILTISLGSWMELPNLSIREWDMARTRGRASLSILRQKRVTVSSVGKYYRDYVAIQGLSKYFLDNTNITSVKLLRDHKCITEKEDCREKLLWQVEGVRTTQRWDTKEVFEENLSFVTSNVILAMGNSDLPNKLGVPGEGFPFVLHSLAQLENLIRRGALSASSRDLLVVGAGLSAADAIIAARFHGISVVHVFRRSVDDPQLIFNKLPTNMYPEYHKVHQMMHDTNGELYEGYKAYSEHTVRKILSDGCVVLSSRGRVEKISTVRVSYVLVLIGMHSDLSILPFDETTLGIRQNEPLDSRTNPINIDLISHESTTYPGIYALGPLVGDNFVRFVQGGALAITNSIYHKRLKSS
ncbi:oxidative stress-induced growth inhibitor 1-like [Centruroides vittatus]|uniref:oxidative stress-induced growth inhibitor 1-like n=1 Tax=Centruroides vittatus TaxID=120091 RepID=UPI00350EBF09